MSRKYSPLWASCYKFLLSARWAKCSCVSRGSQRNSQAAELAPPFLSTSGKLRPNLKLPLFSAPLSVQQVRCVFLDQSPDCQTRPRLRLPTLTVRLHRGADWCECNL